MHDFPVIGYTGDGDGYERRQTNAHFDFKDHTVRSDYYLQNTKYFHATKPAQDTPVPIKGI